MNKLRLYSELYDGKCVSNPSLISTRRYAQTLTAMMAAARLFAFFISIFAGGSSITAILGVLLYCLLIYLVYYGYKWPLYLWLVGFVIDIIALPTMLSLMGSDMLINVLVLTSLAVLVINSFCLLTLLFSSKAKPFFNTYKEIRAEVVLNNHQN